MTKAAFRSKMAVTLMSLFFCLLCGAALFAAATATGLPAETPLSQEASHGAADHPSLFDFDVGILVSQTINFFVLLYLLNRFLFKPVSKIVDERRDHISSLKLAAEDEHKKALELKIVYENHLAGIEDEIYEIKQKAILEAQQKMEEIVAEARERADEIIEKGELELFMERQTAWARIREEVVQLTLMAAEKVVEQSLDDPMHRELIQATLQRLESDLPDYKQ